LHHSPTKLEQMSVKPQANIFFSRLIFYSQLCLILFLSIIIVTSVLQWMLFPSEILAGSTQLVNGSLINRGAVIHRDFWSKETPLVFYLHSWAFLIFGETVIASKAIGIAAFICIFVCFYYYYRGHKRHPALTTILLVLLAGYFMLFGLVQPKWIAYSISFTAFIVYLIGCQASQNERQADILLVLSGIMTGLAILAKLNCGSYIFVGIICGLFNELLISDRQKRHLLKIVYFILPVITCLGLYLIAHLNHLPELIDQVIVFPGNELGQHRIISLANRNDDWDELLEDFWAVYLTLTFPLIWFHLQLLKLPKQIWYRTFTPLFMAIAITPLLWWAEFQTPNLLPKLFILPLIGIFVCQFAGRSIATPQFATVCTYSFFLHYFLSRADNNHFSPLFFFILVLVIDELFNYRHYKIPKIYFYSLLFLLTYQLFSAPWDKIGAKFIDLDKMANSAQVLQLKDTLMAQGDSNFLMSADLPLSEPEAKLYDNPDELAALQFVHQRTTKNNYVYIGVTDHARVYISNIKPYWELGRKVGVSNYTLEPGLTTEPAVQDKMIAQLKQNNVRWIVLWSQPEPELDFKTRNYLGSDLLDRYIEQNYSLVKQIGDYWIYQQSD